MTSPSADPFTYGTPAFPSEDGVPPEIRFLVLAWRGRAAATGSAAPTHPVPEQPIHPPSDPHPPRDPGPDASHGSPGDGPPRAAADWVAFMLIQAGRVLAEQRKLSRSTDPGTLSVPGGPVDPGESLE